MDFACLGCDRAVTLSPIDATQVNMPDVTSHLDAASGQSTGSVTVGAAAAGLRAGGLQRSDIARVGAVGEWGWR